MKEINVYTRTHKRNVNNMMYTSNVFTRIYTCKPDMSLPLLHRQAGGSHRCSWKNCKVLQRTTPVLLCTTKYYASTTLYYNVLRQYYSVLLRYYSLLQRTTTYYSNVLLCTTTYYASTTTYYSLLQSTTPVLLCTTKYYNALLQYYSVLQSTTPVLLCTTKYYASTTPVLLCTTQYYASTTLYYPVLQRTILCTTTYYASTTLYYKVLLQYHSVLQSTTPVLLRTALRNKSHRPTSPNIAPATQNECHQWSASHMKAEFQCVEQVKSPSNLTKYCACHAKWMSSLICVTYESSFPMPGASQVTLQPHQILRLPRKMNVRNDLRHIWKLISNKWS